MNNPPVISAFLIRLSNINVFVEFLPSNPITHSLFVYFRLNAVSLVFFFVLSYINAFNLIVSESS